MLSQDITAGRNFWSTLDAVFFALRWHRRSDTGGRVAGGQDPTPWRSAERPVLSPTPDGAITRRQRPPRLKNEWRPTVYDAGNAPHLARHSFLASGLCQSHKLEGRRGTEISNG